MERFIKKPIVIEAQQWFCLGELLDIVKPLERTGICEHCGGKLEYHGVIKTLEGEHIVCPGDWVIKGIQGEYYPCKPDIFDATYEKSEP